MTFFFFNYFSLASTVLCEGFTMSDNLTSMCLITQNLRLTFLLCCDTLVSIQPLDFMLAIPSGSSHRDFVIKLDGVGPVDNRPSND